jgi:hypothetical protein
MARALYEEIQMVIFVEIASHSVKSFGLRGLRRPITTQAVRPPKAKMNAISSARKVIHVPIHQIVVAVFVEIGHHCEASRIVILR